MSSAPVSLTEFATQSDVIAPTHKLGSGHRGTSGTVIGIRPHENHALPAGEIERMLLEIGFMEGSRVEVLHEGPLGRDPIAVRVDNMRIALRRNEANAILIQPDED